MGEPKPPRNRDLDDIPAKSGEELGKKEPTWPQPGPERPRDAPIPEEETYERAPERQPPVRDEGVH